MKWLALDMETTGLDTATARIVELALCGAEGEVFHSFVDPGCHIAPEATAVHGITDETVSGQPMFAVIAQTVQNMLNGVGLVSYNGRSFDVLILDRELREAGQPGIDLDRVREIDLYRVWQEAEPRTLVGALKRYCQREHGDAHGALADASALVELLRAMATVHGLSTSQMIAMSRPANEVDRSGKLRRVEDGTVVFAFGQHEGEPVSAHADYIEWMRRKDFPADTLQALREVGV